MHFDPMFCGASSSLALENLEKLQKSCLGFKWESSRVSSRRPPWLSCTAPPHLSLRSSGGKNFYFLAKPIPSAWPYKPSLLLHFCWKGHQIWTSASWPQLPLQALGIWIWGLVLGHKDKVAPGLSLSIEAVSALAKTWTTMRTCWYGCRGPQGVTQQSPSRVVSVIRQQARPQAYVIEDRWGHSWWVEEDSLVAPRKH